MKDKHKKHPSISRKSIGCYHSVEWAIYGSSCSNINSIVEDISTLCSANILYVDADHSQESQQFIQLQDRKKQYKQSTNNLANEFDDRLRSAEADFVLVNGNHYPASRQIVIIDPQKRDSLERRKDQLDNISVIICEHSSDEIYDFVLDRMNDRTKVFDSRQGFLDWFQAETTEVIPPLKMLVLAGGMSSRMGANKARLSYHEGKEQVQLLLDLAKNLELEAMVSVAADFTETNWDGHDVVIDRMREMGPFGAIISAFMHDSSSAWLVLACDLPFIKKEDLKKLIDSRDSSKMATAFKASSKPFPEPLVTIYEPKSYPRLLNFMSLGYACPRKVLINSDIEIVEIDNEIIVYNANTPDEYEEAIDMLKENR